MNSIIPKIKIRIRDQKILLFFQDELIESKVVDGDDENDVFPDSVGDLLGIQVKSERNDFMVRTKSLEILISFSVLHYRQLK